MDLFTRAARNGLVLSAGNHTGGVCYAPSSSRGARRRATALRRNRRIGRARLRADLRALLG